MFLFAVRVGANNVRKLSEAHVLLKDRFKVLSTSAGGSLKRQKSSASAAAEALSGDAAVIQSLKLLINCRVCEVKQKSKVITKCMHSFCSECIQSNLDVSTRMHTHRQGCLLDRDESMLIRVCVCGVLLQTRLRKCPQCGLRFGENDVKPLYL